MRNRIMILCTFCAIAIFSFAQEKFSIQGIANEELNNQLLYLYLMGEGNGKNTKEVVLDSTTVEKGKFSFSGVHQMPDIAIKGYGWRNLSVDSRKRKNISEYCCE